MIYACALCVGLCLLILAGIVAYYVLLGLSVAVYEVCRFVRRLVR